MTGDDVDKRLDELVSVSAEYNRRNGITGVLAYSGNHFAQLIEGDSSAIDTLVDKLLRDARHTNMVTLREAGIRQRQLKTWGLSYNGRATYIDKFLGRLHLGENGQADVARLEHLLFQFATHRA